MTTSLKCSSKKQILGMIILQLEVEKLIANDDDEYNDDDKL